jgi:hypothetical protein
MWQLILCFIYRLLEQRVAGCAAGFKRPRYRVARHSALDGVEPDTCSGYLLACQMLLLDAGLLLSLYLGWRIAGSNVIRWGIDSG